MNKFNIIYISFVFLLLFQSSCKKFLELEMPKSKLTRESVFVDRSTSETALAGLYSDLRSYGFLTAGRKFSETAATLISYYGDELTASQPLLTTDKHMFFRLEILPTNNYLQKNFWDQPYANIFIANSIIEGALNSTTLEKEYKDQILGEALFVRALDHFYLVNTFGAIPYVTSTDYNATRQQSRLSQSKVYELVLNDLLEAESLVPDTYPDSERVRPNKSVVKAFLARVYLYSGDWEKAVLKSTEVIDNDNYKLLSDLNSVFLKGSKEALWQFKPETSTTNTYEGEKYIMVWSPAADITGFVLSDSFLESFEPGDKRKIHWLNTFTYGTNSWLYPYKYKINESNSTVSLEYTVVFRLAEQYLIRAEAYAQQGNNTASLRDLNIIRSRAGLPDFVSGSKSEILEAILQERRVELFLEQGHRWFDLKRSGKVDEVMSKIKSNWQSYKALLPIPPKEILANKNLLPQNEGYDY